jgi:lyso-ornithine lipid O-acyltransferase
MAIAQPSSRLRAGWRIALLVLTLLYYLLVHSLWRLLRRRSPWPPRFLGAAARACACDWRIAGAPRERDVLFVSNHLSWLDILALGGASGGAFVSKAEVGRWPLIRHLADLNDTIYVERAARGSVRGQADTLRAALTSGRPAALFAEGTTGDGHTLLPFAASLFASLYPPLPGLRVQPVVLVYDNPDAIAWHGDEPAAANAMRVLGLRGRRKLVIHFLEPIDPQAAGGRKAIAAAARDAIAAALPRGL